LAVLIDGDAAAGCPEASVLILDYFVAGPTVALRSSPAFDGPRPARLAFSVLHPGGETIGLASAEIGGSGGRNVACELRPAAAGADVTSLVEAARLLARVCRKLGAGEIQIAGLPPAGAVLQPLRADGFEPAAAATWRTTGARLPRVARKARSMEELYRDPFEVIWNFEPRPWPLLRPLIAYLSGLGAARVLDIGCGYGKTAVLLEELGFEVYGVDVSGSAIRLCRRWTSAPQRFLPASAAALPFDAETFDAVLDVGCLHCADHDAVSPSLVEVRRVLKTGGRLFSRLLKPRSEAWLKDQRYQTDRLGFTPDEARTLFQREFEVELEEDPELIRIQATKWRPL
jgi:SAM-dependent methyltransferase